MRRRLRIARHALSSLRSEKTILLAVAIQLFVAAFSSFMVVGLVSLSDPGATQGQYTVDLAVSGTASDDLAAAVDANDRRRVRQFESRAAALDAFDSGVVDGVLHTERTADGRIHVQAIGPDGEFRTTLVVVQMRDALETFERTERLAVAETFSTRPLQVPDLPTGSPYVEFTYTVLIPLLVFLPAFISGSIAADSLAEEIERGTLELLLVAPVTPAGVLDGKTLAMTVIVPAQATLWLGFLALNGTRIAHPLTILVLVTGLAVVLVSLGAALALVLRSRTEAQLVYSLSAMALFGFATLLPEDPANVVAKLAIGSSTATTLLTVLGVAAAAVPIYALVRRVVARQSLAE